MLSVIFEVNPRTTEWNTYLDTAKMLRPELGLDPRAEGLLDWTYSTRCLPRAISSC
jgi:hypothetical protein